MRTFTHNLGPKNDFFHQLAQTYKRDLPPLLPTDLEKDELESMEETDTEKNFKKVNIRDSKKTDKHLFRNCNKFKEEVVRPNNADQIENYKRQYELEKLRYSEERHKYFY